eukprot:CAMPEP_0194297592 /NCGR_PEP_ID=MMETSP0169-20130528/59256_1 /TAXON_ID=218684 /ORGANISM="Corethron pennatum, Strain L29A3" /LENGTH=494 /DNA_ID=CAMNT_0039047441 /DNA_START=73 /DNA_END=1554 /DNA_ORIENTATION=+
MTHLITLILSCLPLALAQSADFGDYSISIQSIYVNHNFAINLRFLVGSTATSFNTTLLNQDCETQLDEVLRLNDPVSAIGGNPNVYSMNIIADTNLFSNSHLVTPSDFDAFGYSAGSLNFCVKAEAYAGDISVTFLKQRVRIFYDLTMNTFSVDDLSLSQQLGWGDYSISDPSISVNNLEDVTFAINLEYLVGVDATSFNVTLQNNDCTTEPDEVIRLKSPAAAVGVDPNMYSAEIIANTSLFMHSPLVTPANFDAFGYSVGDLSFCVRADAYEEDISVTFQKTRLKIYYDLTSNTFSVNVSSETKESNVQYLDIISNHEVSACKCDSISYVCIDESIATVLTQNDFLHICLFVSDSAVSISNFDMSITQEGNDVYPIVDMGNNGPVAVSSSISRISKIDDKVRVSSRLISALFDSEENYFNVEGNAYLQFNEERTERELGSIQASDYRGLQSSPIEEPSTNWLKGNPEGNAPFSLTIKIESSFDQSDNIFGRW